MQVADAPEHHQCGSVCVTDEPMGVGATQNRAVCLQNVDTLVRSKDWSSEAAQPLRSWLDSEEGDGRGGL